MPLKFAFNQDKAVEALAYVAGKWPGVTPFYVAKILFYADKSHLNLYGRPVVADTYIAMPRGPVPSSIRDIINRNFEYSEEPDNLAAAVNIDASGRYPRVYKRAEYTTFNLISQSDMECLDEAIAFCQPKSLDALSQLTHLEKAWSNAPPNRPMNYEDFFDETNPNKDALLLEAREFARFGII